MPRNHYASGASVYRQKGGDLGLSNVQMKLLPKQIYPDLLRQIIIVIGNEKNTQLLTTQKHNAEILEQLMKRDVKIYSSNFDADNGGKVKSVYIEDVTFCDIKDSYPNGSASTYIKNSDGSLDPSWGVRNATAGIPFIYDKHTYYMAWKSLRGSPDKNLLAEIDISDAVPYRSGLRAITPYASLTPPECIIYQTRKRMLP
ncbi:MAG: hypothetical protein KGJ32_01680 [Xanthomonadaceae bacterium]|nr:hypothetical protein [Xanthomonadaceae bacterium]